MASNTHEYHLSPHRLSPSRLNIRRPPSRDLERAPSGPGVQNTTTKTSTTSHGLSRLRPSNVNAGSSNLSGSRSRQAPPQLTGLPRFHPANFAPSASTSAHLSPTKARDDLQSSATGPLSPRTSQQLRQCSEAQRQLYFYHRELMSLNRPGSLNGMPSPGWRSSRPVSPQLRPMGSPGPITPLELEVEADQSEGYLLAGAGASHARASGTPLNENAKDEIIEGYILKETLSNAAVTGDVDTILR